MGTLILILVVLAGAGLITFVLMKQGKIADKDGNKIPDVIDNKIEEVKKVVEEVKVKSKRAKEEASDVVKAVKEVGKQAKQVVTATKTTELRRGRKPKK